MAVYLSPKYERATFYAPIPDPENPGRMRSQQFQFAGGVFDTEDNVIFGSLAAGYELRKLTDEERQMVEAQLNKMARDTNNLVGIQSEEAIKNPFPCEWIDRVPNDNGKMVSLRNVGCGRRFPTANERDGHVKQAHVTGAVLEKQVQQEGSTPPSRISEFQVQDGGGAGGSDRYVPVSAPLAPVGSED